MENFSVMMAVCLLLGQSACHAVDEGGQTQNNELTHEDLADTWSETNTIQNLSRGPDTLAILSTNSTGTRQSTALKEVEPLEERLAASLRILEETNKKLEATERKLSAVNSMVTELSTEYHGNKIFYTNDHAGPEFDMQTTCYELNVFHYCIYNII